MAIQNQFPQHPFQSGSTTVLASGAVMNTGLATGEDFLICPPPEDGDVYRLLTGLTLVNTSGSDIDSATPPDINFGVYLRTAGGVDILMTQGFEVAPLTDGQAISTDFAANAMLRPTDQGFFFRISAVGVTNFSVYAVFDDIRRVKNNVVSLTDVKQDVLAGVLNTVRSVALVGAEAENALLTVCNGDSIEHEATLFLSDGTNEIPLLSIPVPAGEANTFNNEGIGVWPYLLNGWFLRMQLTEPIATAPCLAYVGYVETNLYPAREWQGGAY